MKKFIYFLMALATAIPASAQGSQDLIVSKVLDQAEDTTQVVTINDIIDIQERVNSLNSTSDHFRKVWSRTSYFNIGWNDMTLKPKENYCAGLEQNQYVGEFKSDWGLSLTLGHNYKLHRKPIANIVQINLDYTYINLNANHFKREPGKYLFDSSLTNPATGDNYLPWNLEKFEANFSMELGPSVTVAPFTYIDVPGLHFLKLNGYFHVGYEVSGILYMKGKDFAKPAKNENDEAGNSPMATRAFGNSGGDVVSDATNINLGHGLTKTFGLNLSWKAISVGFEKRTANVKYQSVEPSLYGKQKYKFDNSNTRLYLQIRY